MAILSFRVPEAYDGSRLDSFLREQYQVSGTVLKRAKRIPGGLLMDGTPLRTIDPVRSGALVTLDTGAEERLYIPCGLDVSVLYEDEAMVVFNKPPGIPSHPSKGHRDDTMTNVFAAREETRGLVYRPVNRLDKDTSGILIVAKHAHAASALKNAIQKTYLALVCGRGLPDEGTVDGPIDRCEPGGQRRAVLEGGKPAVTHFWTLARGGAHALVRLRLETGRTHQIRVHMAHIGHPLSGDALYGGDGLMARQALHCSELELLHPLQRRRIDRFAPPPDDFRNAALCAIGEKALAFLSGGDRAGGGYHDGNEAKE